MITEYDYQHCQNNTDFCYCPGKKVFYLVDESECGGKGANTVASMAHHFFKHHGHGKKHAAIHFDNCCGQNKNNTILWYALWRVGQGIYRIGHLINLNTNCLTL